MSDWKEIGIKMRLDKFLKVSRLIKRRTVANEACDAGRVSINGKEAKASVNVKVGDEIEIAFGQKTVKVRVLDIQDTTKKDEAKDLFEYIS
jgi:ribosomal 50S subunit-recycling heat shock protein